jgi:putative tryptophan/tyrosine transport system substrate-binding protein
LDNAGNSRTRRLPSRAFTLVLSAFLWAPWTSAEAQEPPKLPRVGVLTALAHAAISTRIEGFRQGLRELGYVEGKNILLEYRSAEGQLDRLPALAAELDRLRVDVIVTGGPQATRPARNATATIPIVMAQDSNPVEAGFVASLARPGGNITGLSNLYPELSGKQLELLKEIVPGLSRVAVLGQSTEPGNAQAWSAAERGAGLLGLKLQYVDVRGAGDIEPAFQAAKKDRADAVLVLGSPLGVSHRARFAELAARSRLPTMHQAGEFVEAGGLVTYGVNIVDLWRRAATYVDRILKGAKPADLPVEQPTRFELIVNLNAARQIGLAIPPNVLARADRVIN